MIDLEKEREFCNEWLSEKQDNEAFTFIEVNGSNINNEVSILDVWLARAELAQAEITELKQQIKGLKDLNIDLQYSRQRVRVELSDLDGVFTELKQKLEKLESGEFVLVPREPSAEILEDLAKEYMFTHPDDAIHEAQDSYKAIIEAVEKNDE